jgi:prephenate dehydrogenase
VRTASGLGAGVPDPGGEAALAVVAVPPDLLGAVSGQVLKEQPGAVVTDVGSVKSRPLAEVARAVPDDVRRYVGSHPMAGTEHSGPLAGSASLFEGRPWAVTPHGRAGREAVAAVTALAEACGALPLQMTPQEHDLAVARMSHLPHLISVLMAGRLAGAPAAHLALAGPGVRDVTRVAGSDPRLWEQIVTLNADALVGFLEELDADLGVLRAAVARGDRDGVHRVLVRGNQGTRAIPGKHGGPARPVSSVFVSVPDHPGELARLFADAGESGVNIEDVHIDHDPGRPVGLVELVVDAQRAERLLETLESRAWLTHR